MLLSDPAKLLFRVHMENKIGEEGKLFKKAFVAVRNL
jgi:hypothetical protein